MPIVSSFVADTAPAAIGSETIVIIEGRPANADEDEAAPHRRRALGDAPFVTILDTADRRGRALSVAEAISTTVGAQVRTSGGVGGSAHLSMRGAAPGHTGVLFDGVPLSRLTSVSVDLGRFQLDELQAVEIYRGNVPAELGGAGVGGAVNLVTRLGPGRDGERVWISAGLGSYGVRRLGARVGEHLGRHDVAASVGYLTSAGDYRVFSDAGTPLNATDDSWSARRNNASTQLDGSVRVGRLDRDRGTGTVLGVRGTWRRAGLPGLVAAPALHASLSTGMVLGDLDDQRWLGAWNAHHRAYLLGEWQRFVDRDNEIGLAAQDRDYLTIGGGGSTLWRRSVGRHLVQLGLEGRVERFRDRDRWMDGATLRGARQAVSVSVGEELAVAEWLLTAALRLDAVRTDPALPSAVATPPMAARTEFLPSPRLTARVLARDDLAVKASAGFYARQPTLVELFGDRGFIVGSPELRSETGPSLELGMVWAPAQARGALDQILVETAGFYNRASDAIVFVNTGFVARPVNVGAAENLGLELASRARFWRAVQLSISYTLQRSLQRDPERSYDGKDLPRHPRHALAARLEASQRLFARELRGHAELSWASQSYLDRANLQRVPARQLLAAGLSADVAYHLALTLEVRNLLDHQVEQQALEPAPSPGFTSTPVAVADIAGLPLPGRSFFLSLEWSR
ncbi:MAG: TonB-dependent receptor [Myxococcales bacterium]|nr:TonB-dependent receptor [Myxococcales bacterium]